MSSMFGGISGFTSTMFSGTQMASQPPSPDDAIDQVFSNLDTEGKGYLDATDFQTAFESLGISSSDGSDESLTGATAEEVVSVLDVDGDGKVTTDDMTESLQGLTDSLGFLQGRMDMPQPPPPGTGAGFTEDELTSQLESLTSSDLADSEGTALLSNILSQFDTVDTDGDGRVSGPEAMSFAQSLSDASDTETTSDEETTDDSEVTATTTTSDASTEEDTTTRQLVMQRVMELMQAYGSSYESTDVSDLLSTTA